MGHLCGIPFAMRKTHYIAFFNECALGRSHTHTRNIDLKLSEGGGDVDQIKKSVSLTHHIVHNLKCTLGSFFFR